MQSHKSLLPKYLSVLAIIWILSIITCFGQKDYKPGYIITLNNDTLRGEINSASIYSNCRECLFRPNAQSLPVLYKPYNIKGYRFINGKFFISQKLPDTGDSLTFAEFLVDGKMDLLYHVDGNGEKYYIRKDSDQIIRLEYNDTTIYKEGVPYNRQTTRHIGILKAEMADAPQLSEKIEAVKEPNDRQLIRIATAYHHAVCPDSNCIIYRKKMPPFKMMINPYISQQWHRLIPTSYQEYGAFLLIQAPRFNERFILLTGAGVANVNYDNIDIQMVEVPIRFMYMFPEKAFRPHFEIGWSFIFLSADYERSDTYMIGGAAGCSLKLYHRLWFDFSIESAMSPFETYLYPDFCKSDVSIGGRFGLLIEI